MLDELVHDGVLQGVVVKRREVGAHEHASEEHPGQHRIGQYPQGLAAQHRDDPATACGGVRHPQQQQDRAAQQQQRRDQHHQRDVLGHMRPEEDVVVGPDRPEQDDPGQQQRAQEAGCAALRPGPARILPGNVNGRPSVSHRCGKDDQCRQRLERPRSEKPPHVHIASLAREGVRDPVGAENDVTAADLVFWRVSESAARACHGQAL